jgi:hypothetical protein
VAEYDFLPVNPLIGQPGFPNPWFTYVYMLFIQHEVCPQKKNIIIIINTKNTSNMRCATRKKKHRNVRPTNPNNKNRIHVVFFNEQYPLVN